MENETLVQCNDHAVTSAENVISLCPRFAGSSKDPRGSRKILANLRRRSPPSDAKKRFRLSTGFPEIQLTFLSSRRLLISEDNKAKRARNILISTGDSLSYRGTVICVTNKSTAPINAISGNRIIRSSRFL